MPILLISHLKQPGPLCLLQSNSLAVLYSIKADHDSIESDRVKGAFDSTNLKQGKIRQIEFDKIRLKSGFSRGRTRVGSVCTCKI